MNLTTQLTATQLDALLNYLKVPEEHYDAIKGGKMFERTDIDASLRIIGARRCLDLATNKSACVIYPEVEDAMRQVRERRKTDEY